MLDIIISTFGIILLAIPMLIVGILIKIDDPGPAIFKQKRTGLYKKTFLLYKFRSMKISTPHDIPTHLLENPRQYILRIGYFIRKYSIDELPQLYNVWLGSMSFIGPRPALWNQDDLIAERDKYGVNFVKPGITGWAQINGRDVLSISYKARYDGEYVKNLSFLFDCKCFFGTIIRVLKHDGIVEGGVGRSEKENLFHILDKK
jgi:O-antigen biosynthesis protein WbqP